MLIIRIVRLLSIYCIAANILLICDLTGIVYAKL